jgi:3-dehydroquinate dehydratase
VNCRSSQIRQLQEQLSQINMSSKGDFRRILNQYASLWWTNGSNEARK